MSAGLLNANCIVAGLANSSRALFKPRFATRQNSKKITGRQLQIGSNKTHSRTPVGFQHQEVKTI